MSPTSDPAPTASRAERERVAARTASRRNAAWAAVVLVIVLGLVLYFVYARDILPLRVGD